MGEFLPRRALSAIESAILPALADLRCSLAWVALLMPATIGCEKPGGINEQGKFRQMNPGLRVEISDDAAGKITCLNFEAVFCFFACFIDTIVIILRF
ncbi:hypothetical protein LOY52_11625 [Pseudomonas sp. B21-051]|uniref:hypothetical protein n=1 Tax=Pseudomonas sp. B21-051 TaxID=2895491 RepID=UPI002160FA53|nr:hypothetical protein [Pseudomonas sp. B21-051]UVK90686.1 hypothetical protein LOY52_11625 [Pseudomonas sp. B21-051]